jgi:CheY-like chemotaxis protein
MRPRILAIDDEQEWIDNFKAWIPSDIADQDSASETQQAISFLQRFRYHVVLLDLSMMTEDRLDRSNWFIQDYLSTRPDGTAYLIVSGTIRKEEVKKSAYSLNAVNVIFKEESTPDMVKDSVMDAIEQAARQDNNLISQAKNEFLGNIYQQDALLRAIAPGGAQGLYDAVESLARKLAPIAKHRDRPCLTVAANVAVGLVWSRQLGKAVSIAMANNATSETEAAGHLTEWLGYEEREPLLNLQSHKVRTLCFHEPSISTEHFSLPNIS